MSVKKELLVICGPTATGKTELALHLSKELSGEVVSADSRQVYKGMDIGTGKELPMNSKLKTQDSRFPGFYEIGGIKIWGYDLVDPRQEFSVAQYIRIAKMIIKNIWARKKLPILVGGSGLYIKGVVNGIPTALIPKSTQLRKALEGKRVDELFEMLAAFDPLGAASMNTSDRKNPRRLIRAIEVAVWKKEARSEKVEELGSVKPESTLFVGLTAPRKILEKRIDERVNKRVRQGIEEEIEKLLARGMTWDYQSMQALGYRQWKDYFAIFGGKFERGKGITKDSELTKDTEKIKVIEKWELAEKQYAKRQMVWFKRDKRIKWFDISEKGWQKSVEQLVKEWHNRNIKNAEKN